MKRLLVNSTRHSRTWLDRVRLIDDGDSVELRYFTQSAKAQGFIKVVRDFNDLHRNGLEFVKQWILSEERV